MCKLWSRAAAGAAPKFYLEPNPCQNNVVLKWSEFLPDLDSQISTGFCLGSDPIPNAKKDSITILRPYVFLVVGYVTGSGQNILTPRGWKFKKSYLLNGGSENL
jgi:hypothetical protein